MQDTSSKVMGDAKQTTATQTGSDEQSQNCGCLSRDGTEIKRQQGLVALTAFGVGAVISGDFFGWNFGIDRGGFGGLIIATLLVGFMYVCVSLCLAELAAMYPSAEGAFAFSRRAFGPYAGFCCGLSETLEYVLLVPVIITGLGDQLNVLFSIDNPNYQILWWVLLCAIYLPLHLAGAKPAFWFNTVITILSVLTLVIYWCACLGVIAGTDNSIINERIYNIPPDDQFGDSSKFLPNGSYGIFASLVFAAWFFIAVEGLPLAGEDALEPTKNIPRALIGSITILTITAFLTALFSVMMPGGSFNLSNAGAPLSRALISGVMDECVQLNDPSQSELASAKCAAGTADGYDCVFSEDEGVCQDDSLSPSALAWRVVINIGTLIGLMTSCHAIILQGGRQLYSLTRNGTFPKFTRFHLLQNGTPRIALTADIALAFLISLVVYLIGEGVDFLVGLSVAAACVSYILSMSSFIKLRIAQPDTVRPYRSPLGIFGAAYAAVMALLVGVSFFVDIGVSIGGVALAVVLVVFIVIYALLSIDFLYGCGKSNKSGRERFIEYEAGLESTEKDNGNEKEKETLKSTATTDADAETGQTDTAAQNSDLL